MLAEWFFGVSLPQRKPCTAYEGRSTRVKFASLAPERAGQTFNGSLGGRNVVSLAYRLPQNSRPRLGHNERVPRVRNACGHLLATQSGIHSVAFTNSTEGAILTQGTHRYEFVVPPHTAEQNAWNLPTRFDPDSQPTRQHRIAKVADYNAGLRNRQLLAFSLVSMRHMLHSLSCLLTGGTTADDPYREESTHVAL